MPALQMPLRQHPSAQGLRHTDPLRQHAPPEPAFNNGHAGTNNSALEKALPPIGAQAFQDHRFASRKLSTAHGHTNSRDRFDAPSPPPDAQRRARQHLDGTSSGGPGPSQFTQNNASRSPSPVSRISSQAAYETPATSLDLPALQAQSALESDLMEPLEGDLAGSFDLVAPREEGYELFSLEKRSEQLFSREHLEIIFSSPSSLLKFTAFLSTHRSQSVSMLVYYLDALKALKAIKYANAIAEALSPISKQDFTSNSARATHNKELEDKAYRAFTVLVDQDLPAYVTQMYIQIVSLSISQRITGTLAPHLREASEGLAEVFCLTDPSRPDNPIVFASEEFHRTTQYGMNYAIGRNCRFLQGPRTNALSRRRLGDAVRDGREHCEVFLNYRRDGSPFMNMLMIAPLCDSRGKIRYFIGAQVDVSGLAKDCTDMETLQQLIEKQQSAQSDRHNSNELRGQQEAKDDFQELSEMLNMAELETVRKHGGQMHREYQDEDADSRQAPHMPRLLLQEPNTAGETPVFDQGGRRSGRLSGIYQNYLLIRPYPSFRILFASPSLRVPGILQSPFMDKIGGSSRVRNELSAALAEGRGVTAKVRWVSKADEDGRSRWIHCTPLLGSNGQIGVWMIVLVDEDQLPNRKWKQAPPVAPPRGQVYGSSHDDEDRIGSDSGSTGGYITQTDPIPNEHSMRAQYTVRRGGNGGSLASGRSASPNSVLI